MSELTHYRVHYSIATYSGTVDVFADPDADADHVKAKARSLLRQRSGGSLPFGSESYRIEVVS